jgi:hypothetical protein
MRTITDLLVVFLLSLGSPTWLLAQSLSADRFLDGVSAHPVGDEAEQIRYQETYQALNVAPASEVEAVLPAVLIHARAGGEARERVYATGFLLDIALRLDGAALLSSGSDAIAHLILDANPAVQREALAVMDYVIAKPGTNRQPYLSALQTALQDRQTPQDAAVEMIRPLLTFGFSNPEALKAVLAFLSRDDLIFTTRLELVHSLGDVPGLPEQVNQYLVRRLDDPDPRVRAMALVAYADSTTTYHAAAKVRVERIANDPQEHPQVRELATEAIAGKTSLNPNIDIPADKVKDH